MNRLRKSEERYRELAKKYEALERRMNEEIEKNRQKDLFLIRQSRLATIGEMIANIGHQWRSPLNHLSLLIQDVKEELEFGEINRQYIERFTRESMVQIKHMSQTIDDFRRFYRSNKEKNLFSLEESIDDALVIFSPTLKNHHINVEFEYRDHHFGYGFPNEFSQVVLNLLANVRDIFVERNILYRSIIVKINQIDSYFEASITDNAGGIETSHLPKLFEPYFTTRPDGTGLGLYMSKMLMEKMGGNIKVENTGDGARFLLLVPRFLEEERRPSISI
ncbi:MAG: HAMP domain-containing sensor histidine kinase [Bacillota bacterium]|nr:HAMP domain-containing sensor histidine kinase [Bacillota bacterium]